MYNQTEATAKDAKNDVKSLARQGKREAENALNAAKGEISDFAHKAGSKLRTAYEDASHQVEDAAEQARERIREKPLQSAAIAFGAGVLLSVILRRF